jgi:RNA polymerase sigma-70 factor, ECF subfamily
MALDEDEFAALVAEHDRALRGLAFRVLGDRHAMDDALQDAYVKAFRALPRFRGRSSARTWLYRIVYNACIDHLRRQRTHAQLDEVAAAAPDAGDAVAGRAALAAALAALPVDQRAAVLLVDVQGFAYPEAAVVLDVRVGTIASRLSRGRETLRAALAPSRKGAEG